VRDVEEEGGPRCRPVVAATTGVGNNVRGSTWSVRDDASGVKAVDNGVKLVGVAGDSQWPSGSMGVSGDSQWPSGSMGVSGDSQ
jgi:hypothetical protein